MDTSMTKLTPLLYPRIAADYEKGDTTVTLALKHQVTEGTIRNALKRMNVPTRCRAERAFQAHRRAGRGSSNGLQHFVTSRGLFIPEIQWTALKLKHPADELATMLCAALKGTPMPWPTTKQERALRGFHSLRDASLPSLLADGPITLLRSPDAQQPNYHIRLKPPGGKASNYLFCRARWSTGKNNAPSVVQRWDDDALRLRTCRKYLTLSGCPEFTPALFRKALCVTGGTPSQFKPGAAKAVYGLLRSEHVLDFSAGWGDRAVGFCASPRGRTYLGVDPNLELHPLYERLREMYRGEKSLTFVPGCAEEVSFTPESEDTVFTSPPYFGAERYAENTSHFTMQSWFRYQTPEIWRDRFLAPVLRKAWDALVPGGFLAINIADVKMMREWQPLCRWTQQIVGELVGSRFLFALGMRLQGGNYDAHARSALSGEPIWVWSKGAPRCEVPTEKPPG